MFLEFEQVYLFGSALKSNTPHDIDILLVYRKEDATKVDEAKARISDSLASEFHDLSLDFTTLNKKELEDTRFLQVVEHRMIKN